MFFSETKLHDFVSKLNVYEWNQFTKFLASPFFNKNEDIIKLIASLSPYYKKKNQIAISKNEAWSLVYDTKKYNDLRFRRLCSDTVSLLDVFFAITQFQKDPNQQRVFTLAAFNERGLDKYFLNNLNYLATQSKKRKSIDSYDYWIDYFTALQKASFLERTNNRLSDKNIRDTLSKLDDYYLIMKLRFYAAQLHYKQIKTNDDEDLLMGDILSYLTTHSIATNPIANIYWHIINTFTHPDHQKYYSLLNKLLALHSSAISFEISRDMHAFALNYCIRQINQGVTQFQHEIFILYKRMIEEKLLFDNEILSPFDFKNIVTISLRIKEYTWSEHFVSTYHKTLPTEHQRNALSFNQARIHFAKKEYGNVLDLLQDVEYTDVFYTLDSKTTLFKTYYELGEVLSMLSLAESFRILLGRKKLISEQHRINYNNFLKIALKIYKADAKNQTQLSAIKKLLTETKGIADKTWLIEKFEELGGVIK